MEAMGQAYLRWRPFSQNVGSEKNHFSLKLHGRRANPAFFRPIKRFLFRPFTLHDFFMIAIPAVDFEDRLDFYRYTLAAQHLSLAQDALSELTARSDETNRRIRHLLWCAFFVNYSAPFKQRKDEKLKRGVRLPDDVVPRQSLELHDSILQLRDKMYVHTDFNSLCDDGGNALNSLTVLMTEKGLVFSNSFLTLTSATGLPLVNDLLQEVTKKVEYRRDKLWKKWSKKTKLPVGTKWKINLQSGTTDLFISD